MSVVRFVKLYVVPFLPGMFVSVVMFVTVYVVSSLPCSLCLLSGL